LWIASCKRQDCQSKKVMSFHLNRPFEYS
jgi:hypothetical protein